MEKTIIFLETNKSGSSREAIKAAKRLSNKVILFTNRSKYLNQRDEFAEIDEILLVDLTKFQNVRERVIEVMKQETEVQCIVSFIDSLVFPAAKLSHEFCKTNISLDSIEVMEDKMMTRSSLSDKSYTPFFLNLDTKNSVKEWSDLLSEEYPLVIKSPNSTGSKDVILATNEKELRNRISKLRKKYPEQDVLLEEYLIGPQYLIEVLVFDGEVNIVAVIEQEITIGERFIVTGYSLSSEIDRTIYETLTTTVRLIVHDFEMDNGTCHLEMRLVNGQWKLIEVNPRISGGAMNRMIEEAYGINLVEQTLRLYLGEIPDLTKKYENCIYTHYIVIQSFGRLLKVTGKKRAASQEGVVDVYIKPRKGQILSPPRSMGHRYGYVMAKANTKGEAKAIATHAANQIRYYLQPINE